MNSKLYQQNAPVVCEVFELLRRELEEESDDSPVLNRLHEIATLPASEFFEALSALVAGTESPHSEDAKRLTRCTPLGRTTAYPTT